MTKARRVLWFVALVGAIVAVVARKRLAGPAPQSAPSWPPLEPDLPVPTPSVAPEPVTQQTGAAVADLDGQVRLDEHDEEAAKTNADANGDGESAERAWVEAIDGACPASHPIKVNSNSGIYHVPGGRFYDRTRPQRCYADAGAAEADGYRAAKDPTAGRPQ
jgi:hypothetical protein